MSISRDWEWKLKRQRAERIVNNFYEKKWPTLKEQFEKDILSIMGNRRFGVFGAYEEEGNGWKKTEYLARKIALERGYAVLTGKGIFKATSSGSVVFIPITFNVSPHLVSVEDYYWWFASLVNKAAVFLGKTRSTAEIEEKALAKYGTPTAGVAVLNQFSGDENCRKLEVHETLGFSICKGGIGMCEEEKNYCPFGKKGKGLPYGRLDQYCRKSTMDLVAVPKKEKIMNSLAYIELL